MLSFLKKQENIKNKLLIGERFFLLGIFFLPSALPIGAIFLLISLLISFSQSHHQLLKDKWNFPLLMSIGIILMSTINASFINIPIELLNFNRSNIWINLFNWIPIIFGFLGFQNYLKTSSQKIRFSKFLLMGTVPVLISCIMQYNFKIYGPFSTFYGLIIWFQYPLERGWGSATGLFSNQNYTACFLSIVLPFSLIVLKNTKKNLNKLILAIISFLIIYYLVLTYSRNALLSLLIISFLYFGIKRILLIFSSLTLTSIFLTLLGITNVYLFSFFDKINETNFATKILEFNTNPRIQIWNSTITFISKKPLLGWGASTFSHLYNNHDETFKPPLEVLEAQHSHNIFLEIAHNFGIPLAIIILITLIFLIFKVIKEIKLNKNYNDYMINKTWLATALIAFLYQMSDMTYYDGKISLLLCILVAGLRTILPMNKHLTHQDEKGY